MTDPRLYRLDDMLIDLDRQRVERDGVVLDVAGLSFRLLEFLIGQGDRVVTFDELIAAVWAPAIVGEETVTQRIKLLRQALGDDGRRPRYVRSVRGSGYQMCSVAQRVLAEAAPVRTKPASNRSRYRFAANVLVGLALVALALGFVLQQKSAPLAIDPVVSVADDPLQRARYYAGIGQDDNNERAISLFEEVLASDAHDSDAQLGLSRALSARMCLYNRPADSAVRAEALAREVIVREAINSAAYQALAYALDCRGMIDAALAAYEQAYALDPAERSDSLSSAANIYAVKGRLADALKANLQVSGDRAKLRFLDIQIARNLELLGFTAAAEQRYQRSFRLYPDSVFSNVAWPRSLFLQGRFDEARRALDDALRRPRHPDLLLLEGELALLRGMRADAVIAFTQARELRPHASLPTTLAAVYAEPAPDTTWLRARIAVIRQGVDDGDHWPETRIEIALLELAAGDRSAALDALDAAIVAGFSDRAYLQVSPLFKALANEPRFAAAIDAIGQHVAAERAIVLAAAWLPADLLSAVTVKP